MTHGRGQIRGLVTIPAETDKTTVAGFIDGESPGNADRTEAQAEHVASERFEWQVRIVSRLDKHATQCKDGRPPACGDAGGDRGGVADQVGADRVSASVRC
jgi:hypothetical protein